MAKKRGKAVASAITSLGYEGIIEFDKSEPEYDFITAACDRFESKPQIALLSVLAATQDYQLAGDAQRFWSTLDAIVREREALDSISDVDEVLADFMEEPVNARLRQQKKDRLDRMRQHGFGEWFLTHHPDVDPILVWNELADSLEQTRDKKTVMLGMKIYDIFTLVTEGRYLELPVDVPIPCDLQVQRVAWASGIVENEEKGPVMEAWARVMSQVNSELDRPVSMLRIDSIVWQAGQIISESGDRQEESRRRLEEHFAGVGLDREEGERLARELTFALEQ